MSMAATSPLISPEEYLEGEILAEQKHEYLNGVVYAMAGARQRHNQIAGNIFGHLFARLRGMPCQPFNSDMLIKVQRGDDLRFYYPDVSIICRLAGPEARVQEEPSVIFEVLSESTERTDTGEKRMAYLTLASLEAYVIVDSRQRHVTIWRRGPEGLLAEAFTAPETVLEFAVPGCSITIAEMYEGTGL